MIGNYSGVKVNRKDPFTAHRRPPPSGRGGAQPAPVVAVRSPLGFRLARLAKQALDLLAASCVLLASFPVVLAAVGLVKLTSRGPALYSQRRVGQFGRVFTIYKIRTMYHECESLTGPRWSMPGDPRITRVGKVLRALHIDELPQLVNVIKGEMSLVGPRPERPEIAAQLKEKIRGYDARCAAKPGISGYAQIHLPPDTCVGSVRKKLVFDFHYIRNFGVLFDVRILAWTALKLIGLRPSAAKDDAGESPRRD
jgi:lipopolysaccharide/colanic/teichoic acid biosynthesis glycosyltransferase